MRHGPALRLDIVIYNVYDTTNARARNFAVHCERYLPNESL